MALGYPRPDLNRVSPGEAIRTSVLAAAAGSLGAALLLARAENTTPDGTPSPPRENPSGDRSVQRGYDENQRRHRENQNNEGSGRGAGQGQGQEDRKRKSPAADLIIEVLKNMQEEN